MFKPIATDIADLTARAAAVRQRLGLAAAVRQRLGLAAAVRQRLGPRGRCKVETSPYPHLRLTTYDLRLICLQDKRNRCILTKMYRSHLGKPTND